MKYLFKIFIVCFITLVFGCARKVPFLILSEKIYQIYGGVHDKSTFKLSYHQKEARMKAYLLDSSSFLKENLKDTLYIMEGYNIETGRFYGKIWNKNHQLSFSHLKGSVTLSQKSVFSDYQVKLISNWDTVQIRKEEKINGNWFDNNTLMSGYRCFRQGNDWQIEKIYFRDFFDPKRDK